MEQARPEVVVVGAGAAGIFAAWNAARHGARVTLIEKTDRLGTKILISGGGKCNLAHDGPLESVIKAFRPNEAVFIRPACYRLPNTEIVRLFTTRGLQVYTRDDGRVFPVHQTAKDVVQILASYLREAGVKIRFQTPVRRILMDSAGVAGVETDVGTVESQHVVLAVGGSSYPKSGTTGDGWDWARELGHTIVPIRAALAPIELAINGPRWKPGVALRDVVLKARAQGKEVARWRDDLLFTHRGVSGPTVLGVSRAIAERENEGGVTLNADLVPDSAFETVQAEIAAWCATNPRKTSSSLLGEYVPESLVETVLGEIGIDPAQRARDLSKKERNRIAEALKGLSIGAVGEVVLEKGEVVAGGVSLDEVDPHSMRSRVCPGLYLCGEVLDVAGPVGGYNLQAAFATGFVAGESAAQDAS
ncbi:MAG: NAD(P)/FAD-dependent oxidoreductase [Fimbriimonadaceae bacterium]|nr:NAD(P)/FAD-dependent oxidoreductase [Fimbriimonadaceae bacterium]QYK59048.1 MAG: NAD(P)/FAD-dependent oxidoreductase [Fimbriimonadaceae bacterium]